MGASLLALDKSIYYNVPHCLVFILTTLDSIHTGGQESYIIKEKKML